MKARRMHHFVSRFLLRNFSDNGKSINIYNHTLNKFYTASINKQFAEWDLNTLVTEEGKPEYNFLEELFDNAFEKHAAISVRKVLNFLKDLTQPFDLTNEDYQYIFRFSIITHMRTPYSRDKVKHATLSGVYASWYVDQFLKHNGFEEDILAKKKIVFNIDNAGMNHYLLEFDKMMKETLTDLKLTVFYHDFKDEFLFLPDQGTIVFALGMGHLGAADVKIYLPLSSNVLFCYQRIDRASRTEILELTRDGVHQHNKFVLQRFYDYIGCQNKEYLQNFVNENREIIKPLRKFKPLRMQADIEKIKKEILEKMGNGKFGTRILTHINEENEFKIVSTQ